jgi:hypothetical protein
MIHDRRLWAKTIFWGALTAFLYALLFIESERVIELSRTAREHPWHVLVPIAIAFAISFTHGAFTGLFWEVMGLKAASKAKTPQAAGQE